MKKFIVLILFISLFTFSFVSFQADTQDQIDKKEQEIKDISSSLEELNTQINTKQNDIDSLQTKIDTTNDNISALKEQISLVESDIDTRKGYSSRSLVALQYADHAGVNLYMQNGEIELNNFYNFLLLISYLFGDVDSLITDKQNLEAQNQDLQALITDLNDQKSDLQKQKDDLAADEKELQDKSDQVKQDLADLNDQLEQEEMESLGTDTENSYVDDEQKETLMDNAGIPENQQEYADYIIYQESGWNYQATNSLSGAYGLCQALPPSKMADAGEDWMTNPQTQMNWCDSYATSRYGSWESAYNFWYDNHWW